jgi:hypothetical protein
MDYELATKRAAHLRHPGERVEQTGTIKLEVVPGMVEDWGWASTRWTDAEGLEGGRVLLGDMDDVDASVNWTTLTGEPVIYQVWVVEDLRRLGISRKLVEVYRKLVSPRVVIAGPFSPAGRALAEAVADEISEDTDPVHARKIKRRLLR